MIYMSEEMMSKVIGDAYDSTLLDIAEDSLSRIQSSQDKEYITKQSSIVYACIRELKRRRGQD